MATAAQTDKARKGIRARHDAVVTLIANHQDEFNELVTANRLKAGLSARPQGPTAEQLEAKIRRAEENMRKWREELQLVS